MVYRKVGQIFLRLDHGGKILIVSRENGSRLKENRPLRVSDCVAVMKKRETRRGQDRGT